MRGLVNANSVVIIRNKFDDNTTVEVNNNSLNLRVFWANEQDIQNTTLSAGCEIRLGNTISVVSNGRRHIVVYNNSDQNLPYDVSIKAIGLPLPFGPVSATSGF